MVAVTTQAAAIDAMRATGNLPVLGWRVSWWLRGVDDVTYGELVAMLAAHDMTGYVPTPATAREAMRRAVESFVRSNAKRGTGPRIGNNTELTDTGNGAAQRALIRAVNRRGAEVMRFALVTEEIDLSSLGLDYGSKVYFVLNKTSGDFLAVVIEDSGMNDRDRETRERAMYREVAPLYERFRQLQTEGDISAAIRRNILRCMDGIVLRPGGGDYFLPVGPRCNIDGLRKLFALLDGRAGGVAALTDTVILDVEGAGGKIGRATQLAMEDDIQLFATELDRLMSAEPGTVRPATLAGKIAEWQALRAKAEAYGELLGLRQDKLTAALDALSETAKGLVLKGAGLDVVTTGDAETDEFDALTGGSL